MPLSVVDVVLRHRDPVRISAAVPVGLLAPVVHQPHLGDAREQAFVVGSVNGDRLLAWRTEVPTTEAAGPTAFVFLRLEVDEWRDLLDETISVRTVLNGDRDAARVILARVGDGGGGVTVEPTTIRAEVPETALPDEQAADDEGKAVRSRAVWLGRARGALLSATREEHMDERSSAVEDARATRPRATATALDGSEVASFGLHVLTTTTDGTVEVRRFTRQIDALVAVERAGLR